MECFYNFELLCVWLGILLTYNHIHMQLKKLNLKKNNWSSDSYKFDEVFTETASQKRVYEVVAKPVVEVISCLINMYLYVSATEFSIDILVP